MDRVVESWSECCTLESGEAKSVNHGDGKAKLRRAGEGVRVERHRLEKVRSESYGCYTKMSNRLSLSSLSPQSHFLYLYTHTPLYLSVRSLFVSAYGGDRVHFAAVMADGQHPASPGGGSHDSGEHSPGPRSNIREQDRFLPIANISRIMKKALPASGKIAKDAKETVQECVSEFISFVTSEYGSP
nr:nuclear transcription factor Y subunit B-10 [Ipomoea batatas]